jgi:exodeoxyribonuclease VII small subunit
MKPLSIEQSLKELETLVGELEKGEKPIEEQLQFYEKGVKTTRDCLKRIEEIEKKVQVLSRSSEGDWKSEPLSE